MKKPDQQARQTTFENTNIPQIMISIIKMTMTARNANEQEKKERNGRSNWLSAKPFT